MLVSRLALSRLYGLEIGSFSTVMSSPLWPDAASIALSIPCRAISCAALVLYSSASAGVTAGSSALASSFRTRSSNVSWSGMTPSPAGAARADRHGVHGRRGVRQYSIRCSGVTVGARFVAAVGSGRVSARHAGRRGRAARAAGLSVEVYEAAAEPGGGARSKRLFEHSAEITEVLLGDLRHPPRPRTAAYRTRVPCLASKGVLEIARSRASGGEGRRGGKRDRR